MGKGGIALHQTLSVLRRSQLELLSTAGIIYYTCSLVIDIQIVHVTKMPSTKHF